MVAEVLRAYIGKNDVVGVIDRLRAVEGNDAVAILVDERIFAGIAERLAEGIREPGVEPALGT